MGEIEVSTALDDMERTLRAGAEPERRELPGKPAVRFRTAPPDPPETGHYEVDAQQ